MPCELWGTVPENGDEREFFIELAKSLNQRSEYYLILSNFDINRQFDFVIFKEDCIFIIELKNSGNNPINIYQTGEWSRIVKGSEKKVKNQNIVNQIKALYAELSSWLNRNSDKFLSETKALNTDFSDIKKVIVFYPGLVRKGSRIEEHEQLSGNKGRILGADELVQYLFSSTSWNRESESKLSLNQEQIRKIPDELLKLPKITLDTYGLPVKTIHEIESNVTTDQNPIEDHRKINEDQPKIWPPIIVGIFVFIAIAMFVFFNITQEKCPVALNIPSGKAALCVDQEKTVKFNVINGRIYECGGNICISDPEKAFSVQIRSLTGPIDARQNYYRNNFSDHIICVTGKITTTQSSGNPQIELRDGSPPDNMRDCV